MASSFKIELIEKAKTDARVKKGNYVNVSFEKEKGEESTYRAGKNFGENGEYLFETIVSEGKKVVRVYNANNLLSGFVDGKSVVQDGDYIVFEAAEIKCLPNSQFIISTKALKGKISTLEIRAGELVVNRGKESITSIESQVPINLELSENFFQDIVANKIKCGALPSQVFSAAEGLKGVKTKTFNVNGEQIQLLTVSGEPNRLFMSSGTELRELANLIDGSNENIDKGASSHDLGFQFRGGDFAQGKVGVVASILENVSSEKANEIINYIKNENTRTSVESVSSETYKTRIKNVAKLSVKQKHQETNEFDGKNLESNVQDKVEDETSSKIAAFKTEILDVEPLEKTESKLKADDDDSNNNESKEEVKGKEAVDGTVVEPSEVQDLPKSNSTNGDNSDAEETSEVVDAKEESANGEQENQANQESSQEDGSKKINIPNPDATNVRVPLKPLKVLKHCLLGGLLAGFIALTIASAIGGLLFPAFMFLALAIGTSAIMSTELVADIKDRSVRKQKALEAKKKSLESEIKKEKDKQNDKNKKENKDKEDEKQKEQEDEEELETPDDKKKKKKKNNKIDLAKFIKPKKTTNKEKIDDSKVKAVVETGGTKAKVKTSSTTEKEIEKTEEKASVKKSSRQAKREAELNAIRERIAIAKSGLTKTAESDAPKTDSSKSDDHDMGM